MEIEIISIESILVFITVDAGTGEENGSRVYRIRLDSVNMIRVYLKCNLIACRQIVGGCYFLPGPNAIIQFGRNTIT